MFSPISNAYRYDSNTVLKQIRNTPDFRVRGFRDLLKTCAHQSKSLFTLLRLCRNGTGRSGTGKPWGEYNFLGRQHRVRFQPAHPEIRQTLRAAVLEHGSHARRRPFRSVCTACTRYRYLIFYYLFSIFPPSISSYFVFPRHGTSDEAATSEPSSAEVGSVCTRTHDAATRS